MQAPCRGDHRQEPRNNKKPIQPNLQPSLAKINEEIGLGEQEGRLDRRQRPARADKSTIKLVLEAKTS